MSVNHYFTTSFHSFENIVNEVINYTTTMTNTFIPEQGYKWSKDEGCMPVVWLKREDRNPNVEEHKVLRQKIHQLKQLKRKIIQWLLSLTYIHQNSCFSFTICYETESALDLFWQTTDLWFPKCLPLSFQSSILLLNYIIK